MTTKEKIAALKAAKTTELSDEKIKANEERVTKLLESCLDGREGADKLTAYLKNSDYFVAPASTRYNLSCKGGLCEQALRRYDCLNEKLTLSKAFSLETSISTVAIVALLCDFCKVGGFYTVETRNVKQPDGTWAQEPYYAVDNSSPLGHGEKSVFGLMSFITLTKEEVYAIRWHMGFTEPAEYHNDLRTAITKYPLVLALYEADLEATYCILKDDTAVTETEAK